MNIWGMSRPCGGTYQCKSAEPTMCLLFQEQQGGGVAGAEGAEGTWMRLGQEHRARDLGGCAALGMSLCVRLGSGVGRWRATGGSGATFQCQGLWGKSTCSAVCILPADACLPDPWGPVVSHKAPLLRRAGTSFPSWRRVTK